MQFESRRTGGVTCAIGALAVIAFACRPREKDVTIGPGVQDFARRPPGVVEATLLPLRADASADNAVLSVRFDPDDERVGKGVSIFPHGREVRLRDDGEKGDERAGDGRFSALVSVDFAEIAEIARTAAQRAEQAKPALVFQQRHVVGIQDHHALRERLQKAAALRDLRRIVAERIPIPLFDLWIDASDVDPARSLVITDPGVVTDPERTLDPCTGRGNPNGVWTFKHLVTQMVAGTGVDPADFVERWLMLWTEDQQPVSGGFVAQDRDAILQRVIQPWPRNSAGKLDLDRSPFRLAAIVNRIDLASSPIYGGGDAGEGRFVFGIWDRREGCEILPFAVIFEYGVPRRGCHAVKDWAKEWLALSSLPLGSAAYNAALAQLTEEFARAGAAPQKPNGSALNQIRTNENALDPLWELREFVIDEKTHLLVQTTTKQTPDETLNRQFVTASFVNANEPAILAGSHEVPNFYPGRRDPFLTSSGRASQPNQLNTFFAARGIADNDARHLFSLATCTACHIRESGTVGPLPSDASVGNNAFLHVDPRSMPATLSRFMTGATPSLTDAPDWFVVADPVDDSPRPFNDIERRRQKLAQFAKNLCLSGILVPPRELLDLVEIPPDGPLPPIRDPRLDGIHEPLLMTH